MGANDPFSPQILNTREQVYTHGEDADFVVTYTWKYGQWAVEISQELLETLLASQGYSKWEGQD